MSPEELAACLAGLGIGHEPVGSRDAAEVCREGHVRLFSCLSPLRNSFWGSGWAGLVPPGTGQK